jgi:dipeptidyl aminopeptidase/acylaminoacyl peptidase
MPRRTTSHATSIDAKESRRANAHALIAAARIAAIAASALARPLLLFLLLALSSEGPLAQVAIPIETIFRRPEVSNVQLSPDGSRIATVVPVNGRGTLAIIDLKQMKAHPVLTPAVGDVSEYFWINNERLLVSFADLSDASGLVRVLGRVAVNFDGSEVVRMPTAFSTLYRFGDADGSLLVSEYKRVRQSADVYRLDTKTGKEQLLTFDNPGNVVKWVVDREGKVRVAVRHDEKANLRQLYYRAQGEGPWTRIAEFPGNGNEGIDPLAFDVDGSSLLVRANLGSDRMVIYRYDLQAAKLLDVISENDRFDMESLVFDSQRKKLIAVASSDSYVWVDPEWTRLQADIDKALPGTKNVLRWGRNNTDRLLVLAFSDVQPDRYYLYDAKQRRLEEFAASRKWIDPTAMAPMRTVTYRARDGLEIQAQLTVPNARAKPLPMVVVIHGGPFAPGYRWGFNAEAQFLASRGYAVLMPDFRGTTGHGNAFLEAGYRQWGGAMQDDITDGVDWAIREGVADKDRVCLYGGSYGGYAALMGLVKEPGRFKCAVAYVAVTDLNLLLDPAWSGAMRSDAGEREMFRTVGDPEKDKAYFEASSPARQAAKIGAPVLLAFGLEDRRVPIVHGQRMSAALDEYKKTYEWVTYAGEAHGFNKDENRFDFHRRVEAFLAKYIGASK